MVVCEACRQGIEPGAPDVVRAVEVIPDQSSGGEPSEPASVAKPDRRKLEEQLESLKRKEFELRRALTIADHPVLADAIRELEGRAYAVARAEGKLAQGLSKAEERRRDTLEKKLGTIPDDHPYADWLRTYADPGFVEYTNTLLDKLEHLAGAHDEEARSRAKEAFAVSARYEWMFWQQAWELQTWPV